MSKHLEKYGMFTAIPMAALLAAAIVLTIIG
jgi:hypothetical protein